jgi:hypothetical protein
LSPIERALLLVDWTGRQADGDDDRRRALEALADVLERDGVAPLAEKTRTVAWSAEQPDQLNAGALADEARTALTEEHGRRR